MTTQYDAFVQLMGLFASLTKPEQDHRMFPQWRSDLGRRVHVAAAKRLLAEAARQGVPPSTLGVAKNGTDYLLTQAAITAEHDRRSTAKKATRSLRRAELRAAELAGNEDDGAACRRVAAEMLAARTHGVEQ
jgi:hypothetical protein